MIVQPVEKAVGSGRLDADEVWISKSKDGILTIQPKPKPDELEAFLAENLMLVTHNTRHFERMAGLGLEDWMG